METKLDEALLYKIYSVVEEIPMGYVATYGQIARLIGKDRYARLVGRALKMAAMYGEFPCHRVVNHQGRLVPGWHEQKVLLLSEKITFKDDQHVDVKKHKWQL